jgi:hypothetical protein
MTPDPHVPAPAAPQAEPQVTHIVIRESESGSAAPIRTVRIPVKVFSIAARLVPRVVREAMEQEGFDLDAMLAAAREIRSPTVLAEIEEHEKRRRIVIALE